MKNRKIFLLIACGLLILSTVLFAIYDKTTGNTTEKNKDEKLKVVCTIFPEYDWAKTIIGERTDKVELSLIVKNGVDLHSFQPSTADILEISTADIFIYVGGISDNWVTDVLKNVKNENMVVINLMELLDDRVQIKEVVEGMEVCHDHDHNHSDVETDFSEIEFKNTHNEPVYDEHIWLSLENAKICCTEIAKQMALARPELGIAFSKNCNKYIGEMDRISKDFAKVVENSTMKTLIFCDRFPFRYLIEDYGLEYYAAFSGCSAETEASFETIAFLAHKVQELNPVAVIVIDNSDKKIARTVIKNANRPECKIATLDSMQSTTLEDAEGGKTYIDTMYKNLNKIRAILK